jgi:hypothetical protein
MLRWWSWMGRRLNELAQGGLGNSHSAAGAELDLRKHALAQVTVDGRQRKTARGFKLLSRKEFPLVPLVRLVHRPVKLRDCPLLMELVCGHSPIKATDRRKSR